MKKQLFHFLALLISTSCICGMCSKGGEAAGDQGDHNNVDEPKLTPDATWVYFDDAPSLVYFYENNKRAQSEKWLATKISTGFSAVNPTTGKRYLSWSFENTGDTRFLSKALNPGGKESLSLFINDIGGIAATGAYTLDIDFKQGFCWYNVYASSGALHDSTRVQGISNSVFSVTAMVFSQSMGTTADRYKMSGTATFNIMYWQNGTSSTTDIHTLQCHFNNVPVDFVK